MWDFRQGMGVHSEGWPPQDNGPSVGSVKKGVKNQNADDICSRQIDTAPLIPGLAAHDLNCKWWAALASLLSVGRWRGCSHSVQAPSLSPSWISPPPPEQWVWSPRPEPCLWGTQLTHCLSYHGSEGQEDAVALRCTKPPPHSWNLKGPLDSIQGERELASFKTQLMGFLLLNVFHKWDLLAFRRFLF